MTNIQLLPRDEHNARLVANVHPPDWRNPQPRPLYDLVVIGGGTAGLVSAAGTAGLGGKVALIERHLLGGDCLNYGCVPSKALLRAARAVYDASGRQKASGERASGGRQPPQVSHANDFTAAMMRMRRLRAEISRHDSAQRFQSLGVHVFFGQTHFTGSQAVEVAGQTLRFKRAIIATGGRAADPGIPGLCPLAPDPSPARGEGNHVDFLTNETVFSLTELPPRLVVIGGGPIGCELAQAVRRFGSEVTIVQRASRLIPKDEPEASAIVLEQFEREGIRVLLGAKVLRAEMTTAGQQLVVSVAGQEHTLVAEAILVAAGRTPNVEGLGLEAAGVATNQRGIEVNDFLQTANRRIYAAGDVAGSYQFTHAADAMARICIQNAFFALGPIGKQRLSKLVVPWTTYTDPEVAHVGLTPESAKGQGIAIDSYREELGRVDRAILDGEEQGFAAIHCRRGTPRVLGCTIVARHAGEMIGEIALLMTAGLALGTLARTIHCYPTQVEVLKRLGNQYNKTRLTPRAASLLKAVIGWRR